jgi:hypothetical protein
MLNLATAVWVLVLGPVNMAGACLLTRALAQTPQASAGWRHRRSWRRPARATGRSAGDLGQPYRAPICREAHLRQVQINGDLIGPGTHPTS